MCSDTCVWVLVVVVCANSQVVLSSFCLRISLQVSNHYVAGEKEREGGRTTACLHTFELNLNCLSVCLTFVHYKFFLK